MLHGNKNSYAIARFRLTTAIYWAILLFALQNAGASRRFGFEMGE
jgi:hypothetical protein